MARFLSFHDVMPESTKTFEAKLVFLKHKTNIISLDDFFSGRLSNEQINIAITFDDGYKGWITDVLPILRRLELPAAFFVSSGFVGLSRDEEATYIKNNLFRTLPPRKITGSLKETDVKLLIDNGFTIGGHTINHIDLETPRNIDQLKYEIAEDKCRLEKITGTRINYFSYPTGAYRNPQINLTELLCEAGYKGAVTTRAGFNTAHTNPFLLRRDIINTAMPINVYKAHVLGTSDAINYIKKYVCFRDRRNAD
jgi:peptidoglycan/xylan/chitin deacetylase (PgdA/CDA1 family)